MRKQIILYAILALVLVLMSACSLEAEKAVDDAADSAEKAVDDAADSAEDAIEEAADALEKSLRNFGELDADASEDEVDQAFEEFQTVSEEFVAVAAAAGADVTGIEQALDELEEQLRSSMASGGILELQKELVEKQKEFVSKQKELVEAQLN